MVEFSTTVIAASTALYSTFVVIVSALGTAASAKLILAQLRVLTITRKYAKSFQSLPILAMDVNQKVPAR